MDNEIHYLSYDSEEIWDAMIDAYINAGGDVLYPGDEKEMLLRGVQEIIAQSFAGIDNALRMDTLRYAVRDYLDIYGEKRNCYRIAAQEATARVRLTFLDSGEGKTIPAGTLLTADGMILYRLMEDVTQTGYAGTEDVLIYCDTPGNIGNGLLAGTEMQFLSPETGVSNITVLEDASGGQDREDDEAYRERIRVFGLSTVTTGPASQYESAAMAVTSEIIDAKAVNQGAGMVRVYLLLNDESGSAAIISNVANALNPEDKRPLTDSVSVALATRKTYTIHAQYIAGTGTNVSAGVRDAIDKYQEWQDRKIGRAFNPDMLMSYLYQAGCLRVVFSGSFDGGDVAYTPVAENEYCKGEITVEVMNE